MSENKKNTIVVIPAFNEERKIVRVIAKINEAVPNPDILVINDGSSDGTAQAAARAGVHVISLPINLGYGSALEAGYKYAYAKGYEYVVQLDADGQHEPRCIKDLFAEVESGRADLAVGSRFLSDCNYRTTLAKKIGMIIFSKLASFLTGRKITDPTSGFQAMNRKVAEFFVSGFYPSDYPDADVIITLHRAGFKISEVPVIMYSNDGSKSMHRGILRPLYYIFKMFLSIFMIYMRKKQII